MPDVTRSGDGPGKVLAVDDIELNREVLKRILSRGGHDVVVASSGEEALSKALEEQPEVILLDVQMPAMNGLETCRGLKARAETSGIPVIFVTANATGKESQLLGLDAGAYDYVTKPIDGSVLNARVNVMLRIRRAEKRLRELSMFEELTGVFSRRYVRQRLDEEMARAARTRSGLVVGMLDLDDFGRCNEELGRPAGDQILRRAATVFRDNVRRYDSVGRYGDDQFLLVLPEIAEPDARMVLDRLHDRLSENPIVVDGRPYAASFSAGLCRWDGESGRSVLVSRADEALHAAKGSGKGRTVVHRSAAAR